MSAPDPTLQLTLATRLQARFGDAVSFDEQVRRAVGEDMTENPPRLPSARVLARSVADVQDLLRLASELKIPVTPRVTGMNVGGLAIPAEGGLVLDLSPMDRILTIDPDAMYAVIEPGVSWLALKEALAEKDLVIGFPLAPPETSVLAGCLMDGLGTLTLRHGPMGEWINGVEAVLASGEVIRTGAAMVSPSWFSRSPLPDLTGLFVNWQGATGVVTKLAVQAWPRRAHRERRFIMARTAEAGLELMRRLGRTGLFDDVGALSWPISRILLGAPATDGVLRDPAEPELYVYVDVTADAQAELHARRLALDEGLRNARAGGAVLEDPIDVQALIRLDPAFRKLAELPVRLDEMLDHPGGGLTWVGTYGPPANLVEAARRGMTIMERHGFAPLLVSRPMRGGHFAVLRFIELFDKKNVEERGRLVATQHELLAMLLEMGYLPYKAPAWAVQQLLPRMDPGARALVGRLRELLDPHGILAPGRWWR